jgi:hypothetical protein
MIQRVNRLIQGIEKPIQLAGKLNRLRGLVR